MTKATESKAYLFCKKSVRAKTTPKYVKASMREFMKIAEGKSKKYMVSDHKLTQVENVLKLLIMPKGLKAGQTLYECTVGYQWLFYTATLCVVYRSDPNKRRYETGVLEIARKNFKTYTIATIFILLFLTEPPFSSFFSVAPDGQLSRQVRDAIEQTLKSSPLVYKYKDDLRFKIMRDHIIFKPTSTKYTPLAYSTSSLDGRLPNAFLCDEAAALNSSYPINAMRLGQKGVLNKLGMIISTKYTTINNPFEDICTYSKRVLDGAEKDETWFSLLYEPDNIKGWETDDLILKQANPVALEIPEIWQDVVKERAYAVAVESAREDFVCKQCNIIYAGAGTESYIDINDVKACRVKKGFIDWRGKVVYLGLDLSMTTDNTSVSMVGLDENNNILAESFAFIPEDRIDEKSITERVNYREHMRGGKVLACGDRVIDYGYVEHFILGLEEKYGVQIQAIGYDRYNAMSTAQKLEAAGYNTVEVRQHSSVLHPPTKLLKEKILSGEFEYEDNPMLEINFANARCTYDTNQNLYVNKKKSNGKVDMVVSLINAIYLLNQDAILGGDYFTAQVI